MSKYPSISRFDDNTGQFDGNEIYFSLTASDSSKNSNFSYNDKMHIRGAYLFWDSAPLDANIKMEILDDQDVLVHELLSIRLRGTNTVGKFLRLDHVAFLCDTFKLKVTVNNGTTQAQMSAWASLEIVRIK